MEYVTMTAAHTAQIAQLEKQCFSMPWSQDAMLFELTNPISIWLVALDGERVAGYVGAQYGYGEADMMNLAVSPEYRRRGNGKHLVEALIAELEKIDVGSITLEVRQSNEAAIALYNSMGFTQVGLRPNYYTKPKEAALILKKEW